jgi:hypothetical protein
MNTVRSLLAPGVSFTLAIVLTLFVSVAANAQKRRPLPPPPPPAGSQPDPKTDSPAPEARSLEQANLEMQALLANRSAESNLQRERRRLAAQLSRDIQRLEEIEAEGIAPVSGAKVLDYRSLAATTAEIRDRASRIKFNSVLLDSNRRIEKVEYAEDATKLGSMIPELSRVIKSFLANPVLRIHAPNDDALRAAARQDLERIIKLSKTITKLSKRLSKAANQTA